MNHTILKIGMPAGSLADKSRGGNLITLLDDAGFRTKGYDSGGPTSFTTTNFLYGWDGRPQEFSSQLSIGELDVAIAGDDWIRERLIELKYEYNQHITLEKALSLNRGNVRIVGIANDNTSKSFAEILTNLCKTKELITVVAEMPYLALEWIHRSLHDINMFEAFSAYSVQKYKTPPKITKGIVIYETWGKTEAKVKNGGADLALEITQSGSAIRSYNLRIVDEVMVSETGIYINPAVKDNPEKKDLLEMFLLNLYGAVHAENKVMILFNIPNDKKIICEDYLRNNNLFGDEPTINPGKQFTEFSIQVDQNNKKLPLPLIRYQLAKIGAMNINTIPINSAIASIKVIDQQG